jgi:hypothetical protein
MLVAGWSGAVFEVPQQKGEEVRQRDCKEEETR